ncbi:MAG: hypothetical protein AB4206_05550 [Xenococcaceae cyanobacterium]
MLKPEIGIPPASNYWYQSDTYYQILEVKPALFEKDKRRENQNIHTSILVKKRGTGDTEKPELDSFDNFKLDEETVEKLKDAPVKGDQNLLSSYLPSPGIVFPKGFIDALSDDNSQIIEQAELGNFYQSIRGILHSRKLSQLIAITWWCYLEAKKTCLWDAFTAGKWDDIPSDILDGLIAREIFLFAGGASPDEIENPEIYSSLEHSDKSDPKAKLLILPTSKAWQGIALSLLSSGQAYYKKENKYHQIAQPVLSTGEIVSKYSFESDWSIFTGKFKEIATTQELPWTVFQVTMPYPPIPSSEQLDPEDIKKWATAEDDGGELPFYKKDDEDYLIDVEYFRSPYPYIPLSTS